MSTPVLFPVVSLFDLDRSYENDPPAGAYAVKYLVSY